MALTDQEFALLQKSIDAIMEKIASMHLSLSIETDFRALNQYLRDSGSYIYPSFDPARARLDGDCFWFRLTDIHGHIVASHADRIYKTDDFCAMVESGEVWFADPVKSLEGNHVTVVRPPVHIAGTVGHSGSLWVDKAYRGNGLSVFLPYLSRSLCLRNFSTDFHTGFVFQGLGTSKVPRAYYGYPHVDLCLTEYCPPSVKPGKTEPLYLCWISQAESLNRLRELESHELFPLDMGFSSGSEIRENPVMRGDDQHVHAATVFRQRQ
jgi:hypothetical protein